MLAVLTEALKAIGEFRSDPAATKESVLDSLESRLCIILAKMIAAPTCTSYCMFKGGAAAAP